MGSATWSVPGMTCDHGVAAVAAEVRKVAGVTDVAVDLATKEVTVTGDPAADAVVVAIDEAGYDVAVP